MQNWPVGRAITGFRASIQEKSALEIKKDKKVRIAIYWYDSTNIIDVTNPSMSLYN